MGGYITKDRRVLQTDEYIEYLLAENERLSRDRDRFGEALHEIVGAEERRRASDKPSRYGEVASSSEGDAGLDAVDPSEFSTLFDAFRAGYDEGQDDAKDDQYATKPFQREAFRQWLQRERDVD